MRWIALLLLALGAPTKTPPRAIVVVAVVDGDTVKLSTGDTCRLIGVDTPEKEQFWSLQATEYTRATARSQTVRLEYDNTLRDRYGRLLAYLYLPDGRMLNSEIVRQGHGRAYLDYPFRYSEPFARLEQEARTARRGMWGWPERVGREDPFPGYLPDPGAKPVVGIPRPTPPPPARTPQDTVYVTRTGKHYHGRACQFARGGYPLPRNKADAAGYSACRLCRP